MKSFLPFRVCGVRVETIAALLLLGVAIPMLLMPVAVSYPVEQICQKVEGCKSLKVSRFDWVASDDGSGFQHRMQLKVSIGASAEDVATQVARVSIREVSPVWLVTPLREPLVEVVRLAKGKE